MHPPDHIGPSHIGPYRTIRLLGTGGFATVWLAHDEMLDAAVAIKVLSDQWIADGEVRAKFINEARLLRRIDDDRVIRVYAVDQTPDGKPYFVMALADRGTLYDRLKGEPLRYRPPSALQLGIELAECLALIHSYGVVHRDIKPSNILFRSLPPHLHTAGGPDERLLLGDFGIARSLVGPLEITGPIGTPAYMAPEQAAFSDKIDARADIFAATAVIYELLAGHPAFSTRSVDEVGQSSVFQPLSPTRADLPASLDTVLGRGLARRPDDRYSSALELAADLRREAGRLVSGPSEIPPLSTVVVRRPEPGPSDAVALLIDHCSSVLPALEPWWRNARARMEAPILAAVVAEGETARLIRGGQPASFGAEEVTVEPDAVLAGNHEAVDLADVLVVAAPADKAGPVLAALRSPLAAAARGPVCVLGMGPAGPGRPSPSLGVIPAEWFEPTPAGAQQLWSRIAEETAGWGGWDRAASALAVVSEALAKADAEAGARDLLDQMEALILAQPRLGDLRGLRAEACGRLAVAPALRSELRRVLGPGPTRTRLGLERQASPDEIQETARKGGERWRTLVNTGQIPFSARPVANEVARAYDRLWALGS